MTTCTHCGRAHRVARPTSCPPYRREYLRAYNRAWMAAKRTRAALNQVRVVLTRAEWDSVSAARLARRLDPCAAPITAWKRGGHQCAACGNSIGRRGILYATAAADYCSPECAARLAQATPTS